MVMPEEYEIDMTTGLPRRKKRKPLIPAAPVSKFYDLERLEEIKPLPEPDLDELLGNVFPSGLRGFKGGGEIKQLMGGEPELFISEVRKRGRTPDIEALLRYFDEDPDEFFRLPLPPTTSERALAALGFQEKPIENLVKQIWPETNLENFRDFIQGFKGKLPPTTSERQIEAMQKEGASQFIEAMRAGGWSKAKQDLLQALGLDESGIQEVLGPEVAKFAESAPILNLEPEWRNIRTGEVITASEKASRYPKGYEAELDDWALTPETARNYGGVFKVFAESLTKVPKQLGAAILQAIQGQGGASVVNKDWADKWIAGAAADQEAFVSKVTEEYSKTRLPVNVVDVAELPQNIAFSLTSMGAGLAVGVPVGLAPVPGARVAAWALGTAASGAVAYNMTTYQIMQQYLEVKNEEMMAQLGRSLTTKEEEMLKKDFSNQAMQYGLWEAIPEAISNLAFAKILTMPLGKMVGRSIASKIIGKLFSLYGEEFLTETITQKGQSDIEVEAGLREEKISWIEAFKEVAPQTFLLTTILGGAGQVSVSAVQKIKQSLKTEAGDSAVFKGINENITENVFNELEAEAIAKLEGIVPPTAKAISGIKAELPGEEVAKEPGMIRREKYLQDQALSRNKALIDEEITKAGNREIGLRVAADRLQGQVDTRTGMPIEQNITDAQLIRKAATLPAIPKAGQLIKYKSPGRLNENVPVQEGKIVSVIKNPITGEDAYEVLRPSGNREIVQQIDLVPETRIPKAPAGMPEPPVSPALPVEAPKPTVARPGVAEVAKAEVAPPTKPPAPKRTPITEVKRIQSELEADISIIKKKTAEIKTPLPTQAADIGFARLAMSDAQRLLRQSQNITKRIEKGIKVSEEEINALNDKMASIKDFYKFKAKSVDEARQKLTDYIQKQLPLFERGKLLDAVKNVKTQEDLDEIFARVNRIGEVSEQKRLRGEIIKELKRARPRKVEGIVKGRFGGDMQTELDIMNRSLKMTRDEALAKIAANQQTYEDGKMSYEDMILDNSRLSFAGIEGMTATELQETLDYIKSLKEIGRATRLQEIEKWHEGINAAKKDITRVVTGGKEVEPGVVKEFTGLKSLLKRVEGGQVALTDFLDILSGTDKTSKPYSSPLNRFVDDRVAKSYNAEQSGLETTREKISDNFKRIFAITKDREANDTLRQSGREKVNLGTFKNTEGKNVKLELTKGQMIDAYNLTKAKENLPTFAEGNKFTQEMQDAITKGLSPQEKAWADWQREFLADYWSSINSVYEPLYGLKLGRNENYWPRNRDIERSDVPEHILVQEDYNHFASVTNGSLKARTQNKIPFKFLDANAKLVQHVTQMEHFKAWAFTIRDLRSVFMSHDIRNAIHQFYGRDIANKIDDFISVLARGGIEKAKRVRILDTLRGNVAVAVLGIKPMIAIKQPTALLAYATEMPYADFVTGVVDFLRNPVANYRTLYDKSAGLRARYRAGQYERDIKVGVQGGAPRSISGKATWKENVLTLIQMGDKFGTVPGMWAKYKSELKAGTTDAQAILEAEKLTNRTQNTSQLFTLTTIQHGGSWARLATMFQDQPNKYFRLINSNFRNMINGRQGTAKSIANIALLWVVIPVLFQWMSDAFRWRPERQLRAAALGPINQLLIFGQMAQSVVGWLSGEKYPYEPSPVLQIADDVRAAISKMGQIIKAGEDPFKAVSMDDVIDMIEYFVKAAGMATGVPTPYLVQLEKATRGQEGKRDWRELLFSRWALEEPKPDLKQKAEEDGLKLGLLKEVTGKEATDKPPEIYNMQDYWSEQKSNFSKTLPSDITEKNGFDKRSVEFGKALIAEDESSSQPNKPLYKIVDDIEKDESINYSVMQYYLDWQARIKIDSLAKLKEYDATHPRAFLGNLTQSQLALLLQYESKSKQDRKKLLEDHPELSINPHTEWLKSHPKENAQLAIWGQAKILSLEAYNQAKALIKTLDIPDSAVPEFTLPPEKSVKNYFEYQDMVGDDKSNSWEAQLLLAKDDDLRKFLEREPIETPIASLELKVKNRKLFDLADSYSDKESANYLDDTIKDKDGLTARGRAQIKLKKDNPEWVDDIRRIEAIEKGERSASQLIKESRDVHQQMLDEPETLPVPLSGEGKETQRQQIKNYTFILDVLSELAQGKRDEKKISQAIQYLDENIKSDSATLAGRKARPDFPAEVYVEQHLKDLEYVKQVLSGTESDVVEAWADRGRTIDEFGGGSSEAKVWLIDHPDIHKWALEQELLSDDGSDWNVPVLRIDVEYRKENAEYDALPVDGTARADYLAANDDYRKDRRRREAYVLTNSKTGYKFPTSEVENYVAYNELSIKGKRRDRFLVDNSEFADALYAAGEIVDLPDPAKVPAVQFDDIYDQFPDQFDEIEGNGKPKSDWFEPDKDKREARDKELRFDPSGKLTEFGVAEIRRNAYGKFVPEKDIEPYVGYYSLIAEGKGEDYAEVNGTNLWYEDDWYLMDNIDFYKEVYVKLLGNERKDFRKVPTREVFQKYVNYIALTDRERDDYRRDNRDLDDWLVIKFGYKPIGEKKPVKPKAPKKRGTLGLSELDEILQREILTLK